MKQVEHNKSIMLFLILAAMAVLFSSLFSIKAQATSYYSSDSEKTISIDKKVKAVKDKEYKDNLAASEKVFYETDLIEFKITVENTGDGVLKNIKVVDYLPPFLKLIFYPGTFDQKNNKVEWTIDQLDPGHSQDFLIRAKISDSKNVRTLTKETNAAQVCVDEICDKDDAIYYIGNGVAIPNTGNNDLIVKTIVILSLIGGGMSFRKYARGY